MNVNELFKERLDTLQAKDWPGYRIEYACLAIYTGFGEWCVGVGLATDDTMSEREIIRAELEDPALYRFSWPDPYPNIDEAYQAALAYRPYHPELAVVKENVDEEKR